MAGPGSLHLQESSVLGALYQAGPVLTQRPGPWARGHDPVLGPLSPVPGLQGRGWREMDGRGSAEGWSVPRAGGFSRPAPASTGMGWVSSPCLSSLGAQTHRHSLGEESGPSSAQRRLSFTRRPSQNWVLLSHLAQGGRSLLRTLIFTNHGMGQDWSTSGGPTG